MRGRFECFVFLSEQKCIYTGLTNDKLNGMVPNLHRPFKQ